VKQREKLTSVLNGCATHKAAAVSQDTTSWLSKALPYAAPTVIGAGAGALGGALSRPSLGDALSGRSLLQRTGRGTAIGAGAGLGFAGGNLLSRYLLEGKVAPRTAALVSLLPGMLGAYAGANTVDALTTSPGDDKERRMVEELERAR